MYSHERWGDHINATDLVFPDKVGTNSVTVQDEHHVLLRIGGHHYGGEATEDITLVLTIDTVGSLISMLCEQAVRDKKGPQLLRLIATDLAELAASRNQMN